MTWPDYIIAQLDHVDRSAIDGNTLNGFYNSILHYFFPSSERYQVHPHLHESTESLAFTVFYFTNKGRVPIFFIEVSYPTLNDNSLRVQADNQMRQRTLNFSDGTLPLPKIVGLSALGTRVATYEYSLEDHRFLPAQNSPDQEISDDRAPQERWDYDIIEPAGEAMFKGLVEGMKVLVHTHLE
ncbi:hypothetical protein BDN72DRAFT_804621 [Pluteus cervinus]|uniref:Uncharacterized protein n=1 Tax=Pluteus cervinus TaxID=181527 RepID=A0ACD3A8E9_9AGAR|nr:hypothetical protein BDN72DRAFT_804621 [Pluteus cervinus]